MSQPSANVFSKIGDPEEKKKLFSDLAMARGEISAKLPDSDSFIFSLRCHDFDGEFLYAQAFKETGQKLVSGSLILTFFIGGEKYFFQSEFSTETSSKFGSLLKLKVTEPIFHLQRREDYRVRIPTGYKALFEVHSVNNQILKVLWNLADLSAGGCRALVDVNQRAVSHNDVLKGVLVLPDRTPITLNAVVRHIRPENSHGKSNRAYVGIQFVEMPEIVKNRIAAVVMDLYREFFKKIS